MADVRLLGAHQVIAMGLLSLVSLVLPVVVVVVIVRAVTGHRGTADASPPGQVVRRFFQYLLLYGVLIVVASGLSTLPGLLGSADALVDTSGTLARALTFLLIGIPLLLVLARWTRRTLAEVPGEQRSLGWLVYLGLAALTGAGVVAGSVSSLVAAASRAQMDWAALGQAVVWGAVWLLHVSLEQRTTAPEQRRVHHLLGSLLGWVITVIGLAALLNAALSTLLLRPADVIVGGTTPLGSAAGILLAGAPIWFVYWWRAERSAPAEPLWYGYVLVFGVGASLVTAVSGASVALYQVLVRLVGDLGSTTTAGWTSVTLTALSVAAVGCLSWWYHRDVIAGRAPAGRTEVVRVHEYLLAAVALVAAAVGVALVVVAFVEAVVPRGRVLVDSSLVNSVLAAVTLLVVGGPLWWLFWRRIRRAVRADRPGETASPTRRIYLYALFGVTGVVAIVAVLVAVYGLLDAVIGGRFGGATLRDQRVALGVLVAAGTLAAYHWAVHREDRRLAPPVPGPHEPASPAGPGLVATPAPEVDRGPIERVLLIGPQDEELVAAVQGATGAQVELWVQDAGRWDRAVVLEAVHRATRRRVVLHAAGEQMLEAGQQR